MYWVRLYTTDRFAHFAQLRHAPQMFCNRLPLFLVKTCFSDIPGKKTLIVVFLQGFRGLDGLKYGAESSLGLKAFDGH